MRRNKTQSTEREPRWRLITTQRHLLNGVIMQAPNKRLSGLDPTEAWAFYRCRFLQRVQQYCPPSQL